MQTAVQRLGLSPDRNRIQSARFTRKNLKPAISVSWNISASLVPFRKQVRKVRFPTSCSRKGSEPIRPTGNWSIRQSVAHLP